MNSQKKWTITATIIILLVLSMQTITAYTIEGDTVTEETSKYTFLAYPHTRAGSGWVYYEFTPKDYNDKINILVQSERGFEPAALEEYDPRIYQQEYFTCLTSVPVDNDTVNCWLTNGSIQYKDFDEEVSYNYFRRDRVRDYQPISYVKNNLKVKEKVLTTEYKVTKNETFKFRIYYTIPVDEPFFKYNISIIPKAYGTDWELARAEGNSFIHDPWGYGSTGIIEYFELNNNTLYGSMGIYNLTNVGTTNTSGILGSARDFDGASQYMHMDDAITATGNTFFFNYWFYVDVVGAADGIIQDRQGGNIDFDHFFSSGAGDLTWRMTTDSGIKTGTTTDIVNTGSWQMISIVINGSKADSIRIFINGTEATTSADQGTFTSINDAAALGITFGTLDRTDFWIDGRLDEIGMWKDFEPDDNNITELYNNRTGYTLPFIINGSTPGPPVSNDTTINISNTSFITDIGGEVYINGTITVINATVDGNLTTFEGLRNARAIYQSNGSVAVEVFFKEIFDGNTSLWDNTSFEWVFVNQDNITVNLTTGHNFILLDELVLLVNTSQSGVSNFTVVVDSNFNNYTNTTNTSSGSITNNLLAGSYNVSMIPDDSNIENQTVTFSISAGGTYTFNYTLINFTANDTYNNVSIRLFGGNITNYNTSFSFDYNTSVNFTEQYVITGDSFLLYLTGENYSDSHIDNFQNHTASAQEETAHFDLWPGRSLFVTARDIDTDSLLDRVTIELFGLNVSYNFTFNKTIYLQNLQAGTYDVVVSKSGFQDSFSNLVVAEGSFSNKTFFLGNETSSIIFFVTDTNNAFLSEARIIVTRLSDAAEIGDKNTDFSGGVEFFLLRGLSYNVNVTKTGYSSFFGRLNPIDNTFTIVLTEEGVDVKNYYRGFAFVYRPADNLLLNQTEYFINFSYTSAVWNVSNCWMNISNNETVLANNNSYCTAGNSLGNASINISTGENTTFFTTNTLEINDNGTFINITFFKTYAIVNIYQGEFSLKTALEGITDFSRAGFNRLGRFLLAIIIITALTIIVSRNQSLVGEPDRIILLVWALTGFFSLIGWLTIPYLPNIFFVQYGVWIMTSILALIISANQWRAN